MNTPQTDPIDSATLFRNDDHVCCSCCAGYCPMDGDELSFWPDMYQLTIDGVPYLSDRLAAVRKDTATSLPDAVTTTNATRTQKNGFVVPAEQPPFFYGKITAHLYDRIDRAGLRVHTGERTHHLYRGETHVGWVMQAADGFGISYDELAQVRAVAIAADIDLRDAEVARRAVLDQARKG